MTRLTPLLLLLSGCITETGNPEFDASLAMRAWTSDPDEVDLGGGDGTVVDAAWVNATDVRFVTGTVCDAPGESEHDLPAPGVVDLAALVPAVVMGALPSDDYCRVRVRLDRADTAGAAPAELVDHSVLLLGTTAAGTPFELRTRERPDIDIRSRTAPFTLDEARDELIVAADVALWLGGLDLDSGTPDIDGVIRIDEDDNSDLLDAFESRLDAALDLFDDADGDQEVGQDDLLATSGT